MVIGIMRYVGEDQYHKEIDSLYVNQNKNKNNGNVYIDGSLLII